MHCTTASSPKIPTVATVASKPIDLPVLDRLVRLVNNDQFADVAFRVGAVEELMFGHKAVLAAASDVFRAQFGGAFREARENVREEAIPIVDIEPAIFKEVLRYMYSDRAGVTMDNVVDIYYGADKYLLVGLKKACMQFLVTNLNEMNVLRLFDRNRRYELEEVNRVCLDLICENPIKAFADESFVTLAAKSVELIVSQKLINCQTDQLVTAVDTWCKVNKDESKNSSKILSMICEQKKRGLVCKKMHNFSGGYYYVYTPPQQSSYNHHHNYNSIYHRQNRHVQPFKIPKEKLFVLKIEANGQFSIYGVGICVKSKQAQTPITLDVTVTFNSNQINAMKRAVIANEDISIEEVLFERQTIGNGNALTIRIHMHHGTGFVYCLKNFEPENPDLGMRFTSSNDPIPGYYQESVNTCTDCCVYYVLYNPGCGVNLKERSVLTF